MPKSTKNKTDKKRKGTVIDIIHFIVDIVTAIIH